MPHPDEGLIHAWLDGELDEAEAARVSALVESDAEWAAAAAEARGLIAASARIIGALDRAPANVIPATPPVHRPSRRWAWQAAAVLALMAGSAVVLERENPVLPAPKTNVVSVPESVAKVLTPPHRAEKKKKVDARPSEPVRDKDVAPAAGARASENSSAAVAERREVNAPMAVAAQPPAKAGAAPAPAAAQFAPERLTRLPVSCFEQLAPRDSTAPMIRLSAAALADSIRLETLVLRGGGDTLAAVHGPFTAVRVRCPEP